MKFALDELLSSTPTNANPELQDLFIAAREGNLGLLGFPFLLPTLSLSLFTFHFSFFSFLFCFPFLGMFSFFFPLFFLSFPEQKSLHSLKPEGTKKEERKSKRKQGSKERKEIKNAARSARLDLEHLRRNVNQLGRPPSLSF
jgi:hypothetical protein